MKNWLLWLLCSIPACCCYGQDSTYQSVNEYGAYYYRDLDEDGTKDYLHVLRILGNDSAELQVQLATAKTDTLEFAWQFQSSDFFEVLCFGKLDAYQARVTRKAFTQHVIQYPKQPLSGAAMWLLDGWSTKDACSHPCMFDQSLRFTPHWTPCADALEAENYQTYLELGMLTPALLSRVGGDCLDHGGLFFYAGANQLPGRNKAAWDTTVISEAVGFFNSNHGVVMRKDSMCAWVFVNDGKVTDGHRKLRWESIAQVGYLAPYVVVTQIVFSQRRIFVIDPAAGTCHRIADGFFNTPIKGFEIQQDRLDVVPREGKHISISRQQLEKALQHCQASK